jgi:hypothetical protein
VVPIFEGFTGFVVVDGDFLGFGVEGHFVDFPGDFCGVGTRADDDSLSTKVEFGLVVFMESFFALFVISF